MPTSNDWLFWSTPVGTVLRNRPLALGLFEGSGIDPWKVLNVGLGEVLQSHNLAFSGFNAALEALPVPDADSDWKRLPVFHLVDHLVLQHRAFLRDHLTTIGRVLSEDAGNDADSLRYLELITPEWRAFASALAGHLKEEEDHLFHRVLRCHSCLVLGTTDPDLEGGSVRVFGAVRLLSHGHRDLELMRDFMEKVLPSLPGDSPSPSSLEARLRPLLTAFHRQLVVHARLEADVLFPRAVAMEKALFDRMIEGEDRSAPRTLAAGLRD